MATHATTTVTPRTRRTRPAGTPAFVSVRLAALAGAAFFALVVVHASLRGGAPAATDPGSEVLRYLADHHDRLQLGAVALGFAMPVVLICLSALYRALRKAEGDRPMLALAAFAGGILAAAATAASALIEGTLATRFAELGPASAQLYWTMFLLGTGSWLLGLLLVIGATSVVSLRTQLFPRWFGLASVALTLLSAAGALTIAYGSDAIQMLAAVAILLDSVWILLVSVYLWRDPGRAMP